MSEIRHEFTLPGGWHWSHIVKAGTALRLTDIEGGACAALLFFNPRDTSERYNMPDTLKAQFTAKLTKGHALYTDNGRIALSVIEDEVGWHDPLGGVADDRFVESRFGLKDYQKFRNAFTRSGKRALLTELARHELGPRDLTTPINWFAKVVVGDDGHFSWGAQDTRGKCVVLQAEMDTLVVLAATQHRLDPRADWAPRPLNVQLVRTAVAPQDNPAYHHSDQNRRGFHNTALYAL